MRRSFQPLLLIILLLALLALQVKLWVGEGGMRDVKVLEQSVGVQREENTRLRGRNDALAAEVAELKHGDEAVEERARSEMGLIKDGETFYRVIDDPKPPADANNDAGHDR
ncbi:MAG: cell division protein FtsB [Lysobacteraceae bacterium]